MKYRTILSVIACAVAISSVAFSQDTPEEEKNETPQKLEQVLSQKGYDNTSPAVVKMVSDAGTKIGIGVLLAVHTDDVGFILTSYSMVAGREKVAVILKDYPDALLGRVIDKWIDFDLDLAVVAVNDFPKGQRMITIGDDRKLKEGKIVTAVTHAEHGDWMPFPIDVGGTDDRGFVYQVEERTGLEGAPIVNDDGYLIGMTVSADAKSIIDFPSDFAVRSRAIKPILKEWFQDVELKQKWREKSAGLATWVWAAAGSIIGGGAVSAVALSGGEGGKSSSLGRPPSPPDAGQ